ncbi:hypothetical protein OBBRIDRAFT_834964 [Obba rivulosa]|uniref:Uncharacterized protein n=1 Tax=Obba rivulosa TaxID=1052685 RepID=A0A8E2B370_9APHY|nr:hypothetical protein OBBRIDRAFT_834964 [Obba rivulosa]
MFNLNPDHIETIQSIHHHPTWTPTFQTSIKPDKEAASWDDDYWDGHINIKVYTDRSDHDRGVGTATILFKIGRSGYRSLKYYLGPSNLHTVYEAEIMGELLGSELLCQE